MPTILLGLLHITHVGQDDDPIVEYQDEFGRTRTARRSEVPRNLLEPTIQEAEINRDDEYALLCLSAFLAGLKYFY